MDHQLLILGAGPGGYEAAIRAAQLGLNVGLIERDAVGGTCLNRGCIPTKTLLHDAGPGADFAALGARKEQVVSTLRQGVEGLLKKRRVTVYRGTGVLTGAHTIEVGGQAVTGEKLLLAPGSRPALPPVEGIERALTSDDLLREPRPLDSLLILGGGVIGVEMAAFYAATGTKVTLDKTPTRESYTFTGWYADKALTQKITTVTMNSDKTVYAGWEATGVPDKLNGDDHFAYVIGYPDGKVHPKGNISRAETATIFFRLLKADIRDGNLTADNGFSDVANGQWHNKAISTMAKLGIVKGRRADSFDPDASITRAEFAAICARFNTKPVENSGSFSDISGHWAENEIERAAAFGWISGYPDGTFHPDARITRAEAMTMINRVLCRMPQSEDDLLDSMVTWPDNKPSDWHYLAVQEATNSHDFDRQGEVGESWTKLTSVPDWTRYQ